MAIPFNIYLLNVNPPDALQGIGQVRVADWFEGSTKNFHPHGIFSQVIFGRTGDKARLHRFGFIDLKATILHPLVYRELIKIKELYQDIMRGVAFAKWDKTLQDFVPGTYLDGETGYHFFMSHFHQLKFKETSSLRRQVNRKLFQSREKTVLSKFLVVPAGLRDLYLKPDGRFEEDEINSFYRRLIHTALTVTDDALNVNPTSLDATRFSLQRIVLQIYEYLEGLLEGKKKVISGKWAARNIAYGTRNVLSLSSTRISDFKDRRLMAGSNHTSIGLIQYIKTIMPIAAFCLRDGFLRNVFVGPNEPAHLTHATTRQKILQTIDPAYYDTWMTKDGFEKIVNLLMQPSLRDRPVMIGEHYLGLTYLGPDQTFRLLQDIREIPEDRQKDDIHPITYNELLYVSVYHRSLTTPTMVTRYPVLGIGGIYPGLSYVKPSVNAIARYELDDQYQKTDQVYPQFPVIGDAPFDTMCPAQNKFKGLGADADGDTLSAESAFSDEAAEEVRKTIASRNFYVGLDGKMINGNNHDTVAYFMINFTG